ncbi:DUF5011 domain-containing protein, partial [Candidatus Nomurabacteria bacterium]|nr:DUF5011 domain-containing protein [Candidatus Nomurabacteria bacterium]
GDAYLTKTGDWTGTFDGQEGTYYLDNATHTGDVTGSGALAIANDVVAFGDIDYSLTLASNPGLLVDECYFAKTTSGGGFICEGSTADNNEQLYLLPDLNGADTTDTIATLGSTQTFTGVKTISSNWVNTANPWADNEVSDVLTVAGGTIGSNNISSASTWTTLGTLTIGDGGDRIDISSNTWDVTNGVITNATWNGAAIGDSYITKSGNWTGTFDGQEGSYYLANSFSTSSADYWETQQTSRSADDLSDDSIEALSDVASMSEITGDLLSWTGSAWSNVATSTLGLGNGTFLGLTDTPGSYTASAIPFVSGSALSFDSTFVYDGTNLGIGSSTPSSKLTIAGTEGSTDDIFNVASSSGYSYFSISSNGDLDVNNGAISYDSTNNQTSIANLLLGNVNFADDAGVVSWVDMNVTASSAVNTVLSYTASLDGNSLLTLYGKSDGSGGVTNLAVGIGTTTPSAKLTIAGTEGSTDDIFNVASSSGLSYLSISSDGNIDINNGAFYYDLALNKTSIERLDLGNVEFEQDAGWVSWIDLDVSASSTVGDVMAYSAQIDANELLTVYGEADGSGGIQNTRVFVGTTSSAVLGSSNIPDNSLIIGGGALCVDDNGGSNCDDAARTAGTIYAESSSVTAIDLAENYPTLDTSLEAGELVALAPKFQEVCTEVDENGEVRCTETDLSSVPLVEKADVTNSPTVLGIISTEPGVLLGGFGSSELAEFEKVPVALSGRVPVKVTDEAGVISPGDYVMLSDTMPGYAMKANKPGMAVGVALESFSPVDIKNEVSEGTDDSMETTVGVLEDNGFDVEEAVNGKKVKASSTASSTDTITADVPETDLEEESGVATGTIVVFVERTPLYITDFDFYSASSTIELEEDSFWGKLATLAANFKDGVLSLLGLVIGSQETPAGITIYDTVTGEPYCMYIANGEQVSQAGTCDSLNLATPSSNTANTDSADSVDNSSSNDQNSGGGSEEEINEISLTLNGLNPVEVIVGAQYSDAGVTVSGASDQSYGYIETVDGVAVDNINLDTSTPTQYEIGYEVLDSNGSYAAITRTVIVVEVVTDEGGTSGGGSSDETSNPDSDNGTSDGAGGEEVSGEGDGSQADSGAGGDTPDPEPSADPVEDTEEPVVEEPAEATPPPADPEPTV